MRPIDADKLSSKVEYDEYYHSNEILAMIEDTPTIAPPPNLPLTLDELRWIVEQLSFCGYECEGGPLETNKAFVRLKEFANRAQAIPLTLEELREMDFGGWVWIQSLILSSTNDILTGYYRKMDGYRPEDAFYFGYPEYEKVGHTAWGQYSDYGKTWLAYRWKPEEKA